MSVEAPTMTQSPLKMGHAAQGEAGGGRGGEDLQTGSLVVITPGSANV